MNDLDLTQIFSLDLLQEHLAEVERLQRRLSIDKARLSIANRMFTVAYLQWLTEQALGGLG